MIPHKIIILKWANCSTSIHGEEYVRNYEFYVFNFTIILQAIWYSIPILPIANTDTQQYYELLCRLVT